MLPSFPSSSSPSFHHLIAYLVSPWLDPHHHTYSSSTKSYAICHVSTTQETFSLFLSVHSSSQSAVKVQRSKLWHTALGFSPAAWTSYLMVPWFQYLSVPAPNITCFCPSSLPFNLHFQVYADPVSLLPHFNKYSLENLMFAQASVP